MFDSNEATSSVVTLRQQVTVHLIDDVPDGLLADLEVGRFGTDVRRIHDGAQIDTGTLVEEAPYLAWDVRQDALRYENQRNPLVVADLRLADPFIRVAGIHLSGNQEVGNGR